MTSQTFIRRARGGHPTPATTIRYIDGEYVTKPYDPEDETEQVYRPSPMQHTWEPSA
jgi:hypothetical protein